MSKSRKINILLVILYALITLFVAINHEVWCDEAQVWQLCKHLSLVELFKHLVNEGHPSFFYLINMPFAKLGCSIMAMKLICWGASCLAVYLILEHSPFNKFLKFSIITSAGFLYFFPVIARSYSILPLLVFLLAILYTKQKEKPYLYASVLAILANVHVIMFGFCSALGLLFFIDNIYKKEDKKKYYAPFGIMLFGLLAVVIQLCGTHSSNVYLDFKFENILHQAKYVICKMFAVPINQTYFWYTEMKELLLILLLPIFLFLTFFVMLFLRNKKIFFIAFVGIGFQLLIYIIAYWHIVFSTRVFSAYILIIFALWVLCDLKGEKQKCMQIILGIFFLLTSFNGVKQCLYDIVMPYSDAKNVANFIKQNIDAENSIIFIDSFAIGTAYYLGDTHKLYSVHQDEFLSYIVWDKDTEQLTQEQWKDVIESKRKLSPKSYEKVYLLTEAWFNLPDDYYDKYFKRIYTSSNVMYAPESYYIYEYKY